MSGRAAVFIDRDGTLIVEREYLADPAGVTLVDGAVAALRALRQAGYALVVVTNQSGIARGRYSLDDYRRVAERLDQMLEAADVPVDATYYCPHHPDIDGRCDCRKPGTGMYRRAVEELGINPVASWYVGDKISDVLPALAMQGRGILVRTGFGRTSEARVPSGMDVVDDLPAAAARILGADGYGRPNGSTSPRSHRR